MSRVVVRNAAPEVSEVDAVAESLGDPLPRPHGEVLWKVLGEALRPDAAHCSP